MFSMSVFLSKITKVLYPDFKHKKNEGCLNAMETLDWPDDWICWDEKLKRTISKVWAIYFCNLTQKLC